MDEKVKKIVKGVIVVLIFVICLALIIMGHKNIGLQGLLVMLVGLAGLIGLFAFYNSKYK